MRKDKIGNPDNWFGDMYFGGDMGGKFILYNDKKTIYLKSKNWQSARKEAKEYEKKYYKNQENRT